MIIYKIFLLILFTVSLLWIFSCENMILNTEMNFTLNPSDSLQLLKINESTEIELNHSNFNNPDITVAWSADTGMIVGYGSLAIYTAPSEPCTTLVQANITDSFNNTSVDSIKIIIYKQLIILKADDLSYSAEYIIPLGFQNFIDYIENNNIKASIGLIGNSLEVNNEQYLQYIKNISLDGSFEIWNHGYNHKLTGTN